MRLSYRFLDLPAASRDSEFNTIASFLSFKHLVYVVFHNDHSYFPAIYQTCSLLRPQSVGCKGTRRSANFTSCAGSYVETQGWGNWKEACGPAVEGFHFWRPKGVRQSKNLIESPPQSRPGRTGCWSCQQTL